MKECIRIDTEGTRISRAPQEPAEVRTQKSYAARARASAVFLKSASTVTSSTPSPRRDVSTAAAGLALSVSRTEQYVIGFCHPSGDAYLIPREIDHACRPERLGSAIWSISAWD